jgi:hypothetical protein
MRREFPSWSSVGAFCLQYYRQFDRRGNHPATHEWAVEAEASALRTLPKGIDSICEAGSRGASEKSDHRHRLLRARRERPRGRCAAEECDERAALHSITSSASASSVGEKAGQELWSERRLKSNSPLPD